MNEMSGLFARKNMETINVLSAADLAYRVKK